MSDDHSRRSLHRVEGAPEWASIPEPHPGSGPLPIQHPGGRRLAAVPTVPPPGADDEARDEEPDEAPASPEDELRRRAERRRRGRSVDEIASSVRRGRHALRAEPRVGRHAREN